MREAPRAVGVEAREERLEGARKQVVAVALDVAEEGRRDLPAEGLATTVDELRAVAPPRLVLGHLTRAGLRAFGHREAEVVEGRALEELAEEVLAHGALRGAAAWLAAWAAVWGSSTAVSGARPMASAMRSGSDWSDWRKPWLPAARAVS